MKRLLAPRHRPVLERLARAQALLAFDYDGTLAPIVRDPRRARLRPSTRTLLATLTRLYPCALVTGRARGDVARFVHGLPFRHIVGNHGLDPGGGEDAAGARRDVRGWRLRLTRGLARAPGIEIEDKALSLAIHYRRSPDPHAAVRTIRQAVAGLEGRARVVEGNRVVDLVPAVDVHKGVALKLLCDSFAYRAALYAGDDTTDEDVFTMTGLPPLVAIRVGASRRSRARWYLRDQDETDELLERLVELRGRRRELR